MENASAVREKLLQRHIDEDPMKPGRKLCLADETPE
jgi:hypothetical protein